MSARILITVLCIGASLTISATQGWAGCLKPPASDLAISEFRAHPLALVAPHSDISSVEATTRDLAGTDASLAADLIRVAQKTNPRFRTAIAAGLAQAAIACATVDQEAGQLIQQAVASFQDGQFQASFAAVAGDLSTAATEAATAFATSSAGSVVIVHPNPPRAHLTTGGGGGGGVSALIQLAAPVFPIPSTNGTSTSAAFPVSATR
jgi:hypothetical protein